MAADHDFPVALQRHGEDLAVGIGIEARIGPAVRLQPCDVAAGGHRALRPRLERGEESADQDLSVPLDHNAFDDAVRVRIEGGVQCAVRLQAGNPVSRLSLDRGERSADEELAVRLRHRGQHGAAADGELRRIEISRAA